ncbi:hypothetical protein JVU11DRAFT_10035 [Chiua virens]|nr:hypothetical protein JVU11DRAFT_10035 [Chiua virens]
MFLPFVTQNSQRLGRRKGGGGGGKGGGSSGSGGKSGGKSTGSSGGKSSTGTSTGSGSSGGKSSSGSSGKSGGTSTPSGGKTSTVPLTSSTAGGKNTATAYGSGGGSVTVIPSGQMFGGRSAGGGMRSQIFGSRTYGSGYPGITGRGVIGRGFPFWFWPIVWTGDLVPAAPYLQAPEQRFPSNSDNTTFHVLSDNSTVASLISSIDANCSSYLSPSSSTSPQTYNSSSPQAPQPEQAIQYYRASSIVLTLDGYNNSATSSSNANATDSSLPSNINMTLLNCLNQTIGFSAPLVSGAGPQWSTDPSSASLLVFSLLVWWIISH